MIRWREIESLIDALESGALGRREFLRRAIAVGRASRHGVDDGRALSSGRGTVPRPADEVS